MMTKDPGKIKQRLQQMCNMLRFSGEETVVLILHRVSGEKTILGSPAGITFLVTEKEIELKFKTYCDGWFQNGTAGQLPDEDELQEVSDISDNDFFDKDIDVSQDSKSGHIFRPYETNNPQPESPFLSDDFYDLNQRLPMPESSDAKLSTLSEMFNDQYTEVQDDNLQVSNQVSPGVFEDQSNIPTIIQMCSPEAAQDKGAVTADGDLKELKNVTFNLNCTNIETVVEEPLSGRVNDVMDADETGGHVIQIQIIESTDEVVEKVQEKTTKKKPKAKEALICKICGKTLTSVRNLINHQKTHGPIKCQVCGKPMSSVTKLNKHLSTHKVAAFKCQVCDKEFAEKLSLERHNAIHHDHDKLTCDVCDTKFSSVTNLQNHKTIHQNTKQFKCTICGKEFRLQTYLRQHIKTHDENNKILCKICGQTYVSAKGLKIHMESKHLLDNKLSCPHCDKIFYSLSLLNQHLNRKHKNKEFPCSHCDKVFKTGESLKNHENTHTKNKTYTCEFCGQVYYRYPSFRLHQRKHNSQYAPVKCPYCSKLFRSSAAMATHVKQNHVTEDKSSSKPVLKLCGVCGKVFPTQKSFVAHMDMHAGIKRHRCKECGIGFSDPSNLQVHLRIHKTK